MPGRDGGAGGSSGTGAGTNAGEEAGVGGGVVTGGPGGAGSANIAGSASMGGGGVLGNGNSCGGPGSGPDLEDVCRDFLRNVCKRGKRCRFRHLDFSEVPDLGAQKNEFVFCHDHQNKECTRPNCRFVHGSKEDEDYYKQTGELPPRLRSRVAAGLGLSPTELPYSRGEVPLCRDFLKGECQRGNKCKFRHVQKDRDYDPGRLQGSGCVGGRGRGGGDGRLLPHGAARAPALRPRPLLAVRPGVRGRGLRRRAPGGPHGPRRPAAEEAPDGRDAIARRRRGPLRPGDAGRARATPGGLQAAGGGERPAEEAGGRAEEAGLKPHRHQRGPAGAERPVPQPGQSDVAVLVPRPLRAEPGAPRGARQLLQPQHRPDAHHAEQRGPAAPPRRPAGPRGAPGQRRPARRPPAPPQPRDRPALRRRPGPDHRPGHGAAPRLHGARGGFRGARGRVHGPAPAGDHHEPRHLPHGVVPDRQPEHADHRPAALTGGGGDAPTPAVPYCSEDCPAPPPPPPQQLRVTAM